MKWDWAFMHEQMDFMNYKALWQYSVILLIMTVHLHRANLSLIS